MKSTTCILKTLVTGLVFGASLQAFAQQELHIYNWSDYIAEDTIERFQQESGIKVLYDVYDSNEVLEAKLLAGHSGYDLVFPTARPFADRQIKAGIFQPLDKAKLSNYANLDPVILNSLSDIDTDSAHLAPYMWGTTGLGINLTRVREVLGADMPLDSWSLVFDPAVTAKLASCGISLMDDPTEVLVAARAYIGKAPNDYSSAALDEAAVVLNAVRPNIRYYHSSQYINDLANGDLCVAHGYSGDVLQAKARAEESGNGVEIAYLVPREGAVVWTDVMAIPADAPNSDAAHRFIDFILRPDVIAPISNYVAYANANAAATDLVDEAVRQDPGIYPPQATRERFITLKTPSNRETKAINRLWTRIKTGQ
ncbi:polyamine ABC transporter substrate-binding protein [Marinobacterium sedimentorum]|uniref:polyamine ABC transporter substrate-binding protein n=1 Tax=Marinobacterium sedimentorum TaxID=2927804 RepID=UPI0020C69508|nr:polyamine ABC transporter substrate-binding protein [Marinobacterium sedimentorum]MCP8689775.1 polyamine ABC transporter substrate-binding protein [Marinobacterium sedimentorum]